MEASITAERKKSLLQELYQLCFKRKWSTTFPNWKAFLFMQSPASQQDFSSSPYRFEHYSYKTAPPSLPDNRGKIGPAMVVKLLGVIGTLMFSRDQ